MTHQEAKQSEYEAAQIIDEFDAIPDGYSIYGYVVVEEALKDPAFQKYSKTIIVKDGWVIVKRDPRIVINYRRDDER